MVKSIKNLIITAVIATLTLATSYGMAPKQSTPIEFFTIFIKNNFNSSTTLKFSVRLVNKTTGESLSPSNQIKLSPGEGFRVKISKTRLYEWYVKISLKDGSVHTVNISEEEFASSKKEIELYLQDVWGIIEQFTIKNNSSQNLQIRISKFNSSYTNKTYAVGPMPVEIEANKKLSFYVFMPINSINDQLQNTPILFFGIRLWNTKEAMPLDTNCLNATLVELATPPANQTYECNYQITQNLIIASATQP